MTELTLLLLKIMIILLCLLLILTVACVVIPTIGIAIDWIKDIWDDLRN